MNFREQLENFRPDPTVSSCAARYVPPQLPTERPLDPDLGGTPEPEPPTITTTIAIDTTQFRAAVSRVTLAFAGIQAAFGSIAAAATAFLTQANHHAAPRRPSALNAAYHRRYRTRQGRK